MLPTMHEGPGLELARRQLNDLGHKEVELNAKKIEAETGLATWEEKCRLPDSTRGKILAFPTLWAKGTPAEKKRLFRAIFKHLLPTEKSLQVFYWLSQHEEAQWDAQKNKRDVESKSASLYCLRPITSVLPTAEIPAIGLVGVTDGA